jgi:hypothetical protein
MPGQKISRELLGEHRMAKSDSAEVAIERVAQVPSAPRASKTNAAGRCCAAASRAFAFSA